MITVKQIAKKTMTEQKRASAKNDFFAFYIGRPLSYVLTIPFLYTKMSPNMISLLSILPLLAGFVCMCIGGTGCFIAGWVCFFAWNLLDGVDGNIARYKDLQSPLGSVYDAMSGYIAMMFTYFAWGIAAFRSPGLVADKLWIDPEYFIIIGALSGFFAIFPRFMMHKMISTVGHTDNADAIKDKSKYGPLKIIFLNLISISGFVQVFMLLAIIFNWFDVFTIAYCVLNFLVMVASITKMFMQPKKKNTPEKAEKPTETAVEEQ